jgi:hypothetical protein
MLHGRLIAARPNLRCTVALLAGHAIPFTEVAAHRSTLEQAYLELTRHSAQFRRVPTARSSTGKLALLRCVLWIVCCRSFGKARGEVAQHVV